MHFNILYSLDIYSEYLSINYVTYTVKQKLNWLTNIFEQMYDIQLMLHEITQINK